MDGVCDMLTDFAWNVGLSDGERDLDRVKDGDSISESLSVRESVALTVSELVLLAGTVAVTVVEKIGVLVMVSVRYWESEEDIVSVKVGDHVASLVSESVCVRDFDSVKDHCSSVYDCVSDFSSVRLSDHVFDSV